MNQTSRPPLFMCVAPSGLQPAYGVFEKAMGGDPFDLFDRAADPGEPDFVGRRAVVDLGGWGTREETSRAVDAGVELWHVLGYGLDHLDLQYLLEHDVTVAHTPGSCSAIALAEHAMMLMLGSARQLRTQQANLEAGRMYHPWSLELAGKRLLLLGVGASGRELARRAAALQMEVHGIDVALAGDEDYRALGITSVRPPDALPEMLPGADVISLHLPLTAETHHILDRRAFALVKPTVIVINVARGALIDEQALLAALEEGRVGGAGLDVFESEQLGRPPEIARHPLVFATPHTAGATYATMERRCDLVVDNLRKFARGEPVQHQVSPTEHFLASPAAHG
jgi:phosphoglycerate dehydrogenase-like enzyme